MIRPRALVAAAALLLATPPAQASIFDVYGMGARGLGMGGAMGALAADYSGTFYNPAAITQRKQITFGANFMLTVPLLDVSRSVPVCLAGPSACASAHGGGTWSDRETVLPDLFGGVTIGWVFPFGGIFDNRLAFGLSLYVPTNNLVRAEALDPQTPHFYMYENLPDQLVLLGSLAYRPVDWFSFGVGIQVLANVFGEAQFGVEPVNNVITASDLSVALEPKAAATAGLWFEPVDRFRLGLTYRQAIGLEFGLPAVIDAGSLLELRLSVFGSVLYTPHQLILGMSYTFESIGLTVAAQLDYAMWSLAPDPSPRVDVNFEGDLLHSFGLPDVLDVTSGGEPVDLHFRDILTPRVGVEWTPLHWFSLRGGYHYRPTPAPRASGPDNYLDNPVHAFSLGFAFVIDDPLKVHRKPVSIEVGNQLGWLPRRTVYKTNPGDPIGNLQHGGFTYGLSVTVNHSY